MTLSKTSTMPQGKFTGLQMQDVPPEYLLWFVEQEWAVRKEVEIVEYVNEHKKELEAMVRKK